MIGKYHRVIVTFSRWNDQLGKMEHVDKVVRTDGELRTILGDVRYIGWNFSTIGFIKCPSCGREVACHRFTNTCDCGREFNLYGEELAMRWEEGRGNKCVKVQPCAFRRGVRWKWNN